ncbi:MAG: hypothetical protein ACT4QA_19055 [Panacagrimonas sp.]
MNKSYTLSSAASRMLLGFKPGPDDVGDPGNPFGPFGPGGWVANQLAQWAGAGSTQNRKALNPQPLPPVFSKMLAAAVQTQGLIQRTQQLMEMAFLLDSDAVSARAIEASAGILASWEGDLCPPPFKFHPNVSSDRPWYWWWWKGPRPHWHFDVTDQLTAASRQTVSPKLSEMYLAAATRIETYAVEQLEAAATAAESGLAI